MVDFKALTKAHAHRPFAMPSRAWAMTMSWEKLLFAHYRVDPEALRKRVPAGLELDLFDGQAYLGIVPFDMRRVGPPGLNWLPWLSHFAELNVRTYVKRDGLPGVFFFSLDAANWVAVVAARLGFHLPYFWAGIRWRQDGRRIHYSSRRLVGPPAVFSGHYAPTGEVYTVEPGGLEHFLTERYCLYAAAGNGTIYRGHVHHLPWPLQKAEADIESNTLLDWLGLNALPGPPLLHYADRIDVVAWQNERLP
ncbi:MAG: DUF2071 domain-containing protein [Myxococcota bacterium]